MTQFKLQLIVEGHSEAECLGGLVIRYLHHRGIYDVIPAVINTKGCGNLKAEYQEKEIRRRGIEHFVNAALKNRADAILILLDADDECVERSRKNQPALGPWLMGRAIARSRGVPVKVAVANKEFEAWLVAGWPDIASQITIRNSNRITQNDQIRAEKDGGHDKKISDALGRKYSKTVDMRKMVKHLPFQGDVLKFAPSYKRFLRVVEELANTARTRLS
jgi:hypothetical protein